MLDSFDALRVELSELFSDELASGDLDFGKRLDDIKDSFLQYGFSDEEFEEIYSEFV